MMNLAIKLFNDSKKHREIQEWNKAPVMRGCMFAPGVRLGSFMQEVWKPLMHVREELLTATEEAIDSGEVSLPPEPSFVHMELPEIENTWRRFMAHYFIPRLTKYDAMGFITWGDPHLDVAPYIPGYEPESGLKILRDEIIPDSRVFDREHHTAYTRGAKKA